LAVEEYRRRFSEDGCITEPDLRRAVDGISAPDTLPPKSPDKEMKEKEFSTKARQIVGQPAGPGIAQGKARVIADASDLRLFKAGEVLVCDAVDPSMTFIVPLASAIVERRGGMLIHGAIIAREYGIPCVTGITDATSLIHTGDSVAVDGYLGIVTIG
jgi:pyruvate,water dikinase